MKPGSMKANPWTFLVIRAASIEQYCQLTCCNLKCRLIPQRLVQTLGYSQDGWMNKKIHYHVSHQEVRRSTWKYLRAQRGRPRIEGTFHRIWDCLECGPDL
jgi:hypothetical protein